MTRSRWTILAVSCLAAFTINLATMIVNIALPTLTRTLGASTRDLLWIVDAYNLVFAAFVLAAGSLSDRFGRRPALMIGLVIYGTGCAAAATSGTSSVLIGFRALAGLGAAVIFPTTLSIISNAFVDRVERAQAIGLWGASTGVAIAIGPIVGGALIEASGWSAAFLFCAGVAVIALALAYRVIPDSRDPQTPPLDVRGLVLSSLGLGTLVYTIIEAPDRGWASAPTLVGFAAALLTLTVFAFAERRARHPMLDVSLFANLRFTAASGAVTFAFFALFGFIFLITQYFQFVQRYGVLEAGLRQIPVALSVAVTSVLGTKAAVRFGTKAVVTSGLLLLAGGYVWISTIGTDTAYVAIALQMVLLGSGMGLTSTPATEAIMGVVPAAKAGIGSAVNDATRELGGTLGVAVIGSVALSLYRDAVPDGVKSSLGAAVQTGDPRIIGLAQNGFLDGLSAGCFVAAGVALVGALLTARYLPAQPGVFTARSGSPAPAR